MAQHVHVGPGDGEHLVGIQAGIQQDHGRHELGERGDGLDGPGLLLDQGLTGDLVQHQGRSRLESQLRLGAGSRLQGGEAHEAQDSQPLDSPFESHARSMKITIVVTRS